MKKIIIGISAVVLTAGTYAFTSTTQTETCENDSNCVCCPCTPDCQPGDDWCVCPTDCKN